MIVPPHGRLFFERVATLRILLKTPMFRWLVLAAIGGTIIITAVVIARPVTVTEIVDGDTVRLSDGELVRLLGIDTPEHGEPFFAEATEFLARRIDGRQVELTFDYTRRDHYRRLLGYLWLDDSLINLHIVRNGLARVYAWPPDTLHYRTLVRAQTEARRHKRGIWSLPAPEPESLYVIHTKRFRFHRPDCPAAAATSTTSTRSRDSLLDSGLSACRSCRP